MADESKSKGVLHCAFCGKSQNETKILIAGPTVCICDECTLICLDVLAKKGNLNVSELPEQARMILFEDSMNRLVTRVELVIARENRDHKPFVDLQVDLDEFKKLIPTVLGKPPVATVIEMGKPAAINEAGESVIGTVDPPETSLTKDSLVSQDGC